MNQGIKKLLFSEEAQGMTEYILIVALIAVAAIAVVKIFGQKIQGLFSTQSNELDKVGTPTP